MCDHMHEQPATPPEPEDEDPLRKWKMHRKEKNADGIGIRSDDA